MASGTHYSNVFKTRWMQERAASLAEELEELYPVARIALVYSGFSGISHATYLANALSVEPLQIYVRKEGETSHGSMVEMSDSFKLRTTPAYSNRNETGLILVFVDDFVCSGSTLSHCATGLLTEFPCSLPRIPCVVAVFNNKTTNKNKRIPYIGQKTRTIRYIQKLPDSMGDSH